MKVLYEDNHIIIVNKESGEIVQGDKTGDVPLSDVVKAWIKDKYQKPGNVFLGVVHRLDRPVQGVVVFAKTSKALTRLNEMFSKHTLMSESGDLKVGQVNKTYWALTKKTPRSIKSLSAAGGKCEGTLTSWLVRNEKQNKSYVYDREVPNSKKAVLNYKLIGESDRYFLIEVQLLTGRHHQIRCQLASLGCPIKGDLKYGADRSNPDGSISLLARKVEFIHPVSKERICVEAPLPSDSLWQSFGI